MHVERVDAHAFGPLQGDALDLGPGCNVIHGPNESGKSSWHAALTTALAGRRRGRGATRPPSRTSPIATVRGAAAGGPSARGSGWPTAGW